MTVLIADLGTTPPLGPQSSPGHGTDGIISSRAAASDLPHRDERLRTAGLLDRCAAIEDTGLEVLEIGSDPQRTRTAFATAAERAIANGAEVICLGCAGMAGLEEHVRDLLPVPVVDGVAAGAALVELLVAQGLTTSKIGSFAPPLTKERTWPRRATADARAPAL